MPPIPVGIVTSKGLQAAPYTAQSLAEAATKEPPGVYTLARTYNRTGALLLDEHLDRLERSAQLTGIPLHLDRSSLRAALRTLIEQSGYAESRFRITIPHDDPQQPILSLEPYKPVPPEVIAHGARVVTLHLERHNPVAKSTEWADKRRAAVEAFPPGTYEGILVSAEGQLLEGTSSNFYAILHGILRTATDQSVLGGIARRIVLTVAPSILPVQTQAIQQDAIGKLDETFLTSSGRGVVPIVEIDGVKIASGEPGTLTRRLRDAYDQWAAAHVEPI
ncbi:MAG TPA: aminotransferase class IV [Aggregatilineales bacterium]|nr:aminotransferase class IV [Aggregatilineales bacterium]